MKRLLEQIGLTYLSVLAVVFYLDKKFSYFLLIVSAGVFVASLVFERIRRRSFVPIVAVVALVACLVNICYTTFVYERIIEKYDGRSEQVTLTLVEEPQLRYSNYYYKFNMTQCGSEECDVNVVAYHSELLDIDPFDTISTHMELSECKNKSEISSKVFLRGYFGYSMPQITHLDKEGKWLCRKVVELRQSARKILRSYLSDDAYALSSALLLGDKYALEVSQKNYFVRSGVSHIVVVSGMHFSILTFLFFLLARKFYRWRVIPIVLAVGFILLYMGVTGFSPSVLRSGVMLLVYALGLWLSRDIYSGNSLGFAAIVVTSLNPYAAGDVGLILSFATTYSIIKLAPRLKLYFDIRNKMPISVGDSFLKKYAYKTLYYIFDIFCVNISAFVVSLPLSIILFGAVSTVSVAVTLILSPFVTVMLFLSLILCVLGALPFVSLLSVMITCVIEFISDVIFSVVSFFAQFDFSYLYVNHGFVYLWLIANFLMVAVVVLSKNRRRLTELVICSLIVLITGNTAAMLFEDSTSALYVYDVKDSMVVMYKTPQHNMVLTLDCSNGSINDAIYKIQGTVPDVDFAASLSNTLPGAKALQSLTKVFAINDVLLYDTVRTVYLPETTQNIYEPCDIQQVRINETESITYCKVAEKYITFLESDGGTVLVLPDYINVLQIPKEYRSADIIVTGMCPDNFKLLSCETLVISASDDNAYHLMKHLHTISNQVLLTAGEDVKILMEV